LTYLGFLLREKLAAVLIIPSSWGSQLDGEKPSTPHRISARSLFSAIFVFQKSYTGNILGIGRNKFQKSYFSRTKDEDQTGAREEPGAAHKRGARPSP
jgi:hypothetical protein